MRLAKVHPRYAWRSRFRLALLRLRGVRPNDLMKLTEYRPRFFGAPFTAFTSEILAGPSEWTTYQRQLFGTFVSHLNRCRFCTGWHTAFASAAADGAGDVLVQAVLEDWRTAPVDEKVRAALGFLEKLTLSPKDLNAEDIKPLRAAGVRDSAVVDVLYVGVLFSVANRIADALDFELQSPEELLRAAELLTKRADRRA